MALVIDRACMGPFSVNTYLLMDDATHSAWIVDAGGDQGAVEAMVKRHSAQVQAVVATHGHIDHVAGAALACEKYGVPFWIHPKDEPLLATIELQAQAFGFPPCRSPKVGQFFQDKASFSIGEVQGLVILTPGHTPGGVCLYFPSENLLITGDTLFRGSVGRTDLPGGDAQALFNAIQGRLYPLPGNLTFFSGHGARGFLDEERHHNPFVRIGVNGAGRGAL